MSEDRVVVSYPRVAVGVIGALLALVAALTVPDAFGTHGVMFGVAFLIVNVMHLTLYALSARGTPTCSRRF